MPKKIDPAVKGRCVRQVLEHLPEYPSLTAAAEAVARREGLGKETVRRWVVQAQIDGGQRQGATSEELGLVTSLAVFGRRAAISAFHCATPARYSNLPLRVAALRLSSREIVDGERSIRRAISRTP